MNQQLKETETRIAAGQMWRVRCDCAETLVMAGNVLLAGGDRKVLAFDAASGEVLWTGEIDGKARGLAIADGRLFVSSDTGAIYCFGAEGSQANGVVQQTVNASPFPGGRTDPRLRSGGRAHRPHHGNQARLLPGPRLRHGPAGFRVGEADGTADLRHRA